MNPLEPDWEALWFGFDGRDDPDEQAYLEELVPGADDERFANPT